MLAATLTAPRSLEMRDIPFPARREGAALLRVHAIGICGTDLHSYHGNHPYLSYPRVLGHELGAEVVEIPPNDRGIRVGDAVAVEPILSCGTCRACRKGSTNCCARIGVLGVHVDGGMCSHISLPVSLLHKPAAPLGYDALALCEPLSIGVQAARRGRVQAGDKVVVIGGGPIGLMVMVACQERGAVVCVVDVDPAAVEFARRMGADHTLLSGAADVPAWVRQWSGEEGGADVVIEAVGHPATVAATVELAAPLARIVIVGITKGLVPLPISELMRKEVELVTTRNSATAFPDVLRIMERESSRLLRMVTHRAELAAAPGEFLRLAQRSGDHSVKTLLTIAG